MQPCIMQFTVPLHSYVGACVFSCVLPAALLAKSFAEVAFLKLGVYDTLIFSSVSFCVCVCVVMLDVLGHY